MGTASSSQFINQHFPKKTYDWKSMSSYSQKFHSGSPIKVYDRASKKIGKKFSVIEFQSLEFQLQSYLFRKQNQSCLVTVYDVILYQAPSISIPDCMNNQHNKLFNVILQIIPHRLADMGVISFEQMIYILQQSLKALQILWNQYGRTFYIDQDSICFNMEGKCKIWINQSLHKNTPQISTSFLPESIIKQLFIILESRLCLTAPQSYYRSKSTADFDKFSQALSFIQKTKKKFGIQMDCIQSLKSKNQISELQDLRQDFNQNFLKINSPDAKKMEKFSLKNSKSNTSNKIHKNQKTVISKQQTTDISLEQNQRIRGSELDDQKYLRSTYKSVKAVRNKQNDQCNLYSQNSKKRTTLKQTKDRKEEKIQNTFVKNIQFN